MAWETVKKGYHAGPHNPDKPIRVLGDRLTISVEWLKDHGYEKRTRVTALFDREKKLIAVTFLESDLINGYALIGSRTGARVNINTPLLARKSKQFGYPIKTDLEVVKDPKNPDVWVIQKPTVKE